MKTICGSLLALLAVLLSWHMAFAQPGPTDPKANPANAEPDIGPNHKVVQRFSVQTNRLEEIVARTNRYTVVGNGLHRKDASGQWVECVPVAQRFAGGIVCTGATYRVIFSTNLNTSGSVDLETSNGKRVVSHPLGIGFYDPESGRNVWLAQIKDSTAEVVSSNRIVYADAFEGSGIEAAVVYTYESGRFHQDVTFVTRPTVTPADFGMGEQTRLEVITEIVESPVPDKVTHVLKRETDQRKRAAMADPDLVDETISFDSARMTLGWAFSTGDQPRRGVPVAKRLLEMEGNRQVLVESVAWQDARVQTALEKLSRRSAQQTVPRRQASTKRQLPPRLAQAAMPAGQDKARGGFPARLAQVIGSRPATQASLSAKSGWLAAAGPSDGNSPNLPKGFVIDYETLQSYLEDYTFQSGQTYLAEDDVFVGGYGQGVTFEPGAVIKFLQGASLTVEGLVNDVYGPVVFTATDDNSVGDSIGSGYPSGRYAEFALALYYTPSFDLSGLDIRHAQTALYSYANYLYVSGLFYRCDLGVYAEGGQVALSDVDMCEVDQWYDGDVSGTPTDCQADRDSDGLPDHWEFYWFGNLDQTANGNPPDGDQFTNLQEYQNGTSPWETDVLSVTVVASDSTATKGGDPGTFTIKRPAWSQGIAVSVQFALSGSALYDTDYTVTPSTTPVTIPAGAESVNVTVNPAAPNGTVYHSTVALTILPNAAYDVGVPQTAVIVIRDPNASVPPPVPAPSGLVGWWRGENNAQDSVGSLHGTVNGAGFGSGNVGTAFSFDGANDYVANSVPGISQITDNFTMEFWTFPTASRNSTEELYEGTAGTSGQRYAIWPGFLNDGLGPVGAGVSVGNNGVSVFEHGAVYLSSLLVYNTPISGWTHVAIVYQNRQPKLYLNGVLVRTGLASTRVPFPSTWFGEYGVTPPGYGYYQGLLDEVSIYNRALAASEIEDIFDAGPGGKSLLSTVTIAATDTDASEIGQNPGTFTVTRSGGDQTVALAVNFAPSGVAIKGTDYTLSPDNPVNQVTIPANQVSAVVTVTPNSPDSNSSEGPESVTLTLASGNYWIGAGNNASLNIKDASTVTIAATDTDASEIGQNPGTFTVTRSGGDQTVALAVNFAPSGVAIKGTDYTLSPDNPVNQVTIPANQVSAVVTVTPNSPDSNSSEGPESVTLTLASGNYWIGAGNNASLNIKDASTVTIAATDTDASEIGQNPGTFTVTRSGGDQTVALAVNFAPSGVAIKGTDYTLSPDNPVNQVTIPANQVSAVVTVTPNSPDSNSSEGPESVTLTLASGNYWIGAGNNASLNIKDASTVTIAATDTDASEIGQNPGTFTVTRSGGDQTVALAVNFAPSGVAIKGTDYTLSPDNPVNQVTIPANQVSAVVTVTPNSPDSNSSEGPESVTLTLASGNYWIGAGNNASLNIKDASTVTIAATDTDASEIGQNPGTFTVTRSGGDQTVALAVNFAPSGVAIKGTDYTLSPDNPVNQVTIPANQVSAVVTVTPNSPDSNSSEGPESVTLTLASGNYWIGAGNNASLNIKDASTVTIAPTDANASEIGPDDGAFTVTRTGGDQSGPLTVNYSINTGPGQAVNGTDYNTLSGSVTISSGTTALISIVPILDAVAEFPNETVVLTVTSGTYWIGAADDATGNIIDAYGDTDGDTLADAMEAVLGGNPQTATPGWKQDSDSDGLPDAYETMIGSLPNSAEAAPDLPTVDECPL